jgi:predicted HicB family RNase H-like nuclease
MSEFHQQPFSEQQGVATQSPAQPAQSGNKQQEVCRVAGEIFRQNPDWVTFFREVLGVDGVVRRQFTNPDEMDAFEQSTEYIEIQQMVAKLRERSKHQTESNEPTRVITVRLPKSLHESLRAEAHHRRTSMNQLCISKLLQLIDNELVPSD